MSEFAFPSQFTINEMTIDDEDISAIFTGLEIFENIFIPAVSGSITFLDTDGAGFVENYDIEFNERFKFSITSATDETIEFDGFLNGLRAETTKGNKKVYTADFSTKELRENEKKFICKKFDETPEAVVSTMINEIGGQLNSSVGSQGQSMTFVASRWKPLKVINYVLQRGVAGDSRATNKQSGIPQDEKAAGESGFLCWQTIGVDNEYRFCSVSELMEGAYDTHEDFQNRLANRGVPMDEAQKMIVDFNFKQCGDIQTKMRSGAFHSILVSFDLDTGMYKEYVYDGREGDTMSEKQKLIADRPTRVLMKPFQNEKFSNDCSKSAPNSGDQSRLAMLQGIGRQNTFNDQTGNVTLYPNFGFHAGDIFDCKINKIDSGDSDGTENTKHSGKYVIKQVGHHFSMEGHAHTRITTIRSSKQQDETTSN